MSVHKDERKKGKWVVVYRGKKKRGFTSKHEALLYESKLKLQEEELTCTLRFNKVAELYFDDMKGRVAYGTYSKSLQLYRDYIEPNIKNKIISCITSFDCKCFRDIIATIPYSTVHKNHILDTYKQIFKYAVKYLNLRIDPTLVLEKFKLTPAERINKKNRDMNIWTVDDFEKFICCVKRKKYKALFYVLFYTGIRQGEAQALQWKDYYDGILDIYKSYTVKTDKGIYEIKDTKTVSSIRKVKLNQSLIDILDDYKKEASAISGWDENWYIFGNIYPLARTNINRVKDIACADSGVKRITLHDFRHSHASNLIASGVNIVAVSKRLGHSDINITLKTYTHLIQKNEDELLNTLEMFFPKSSQK